MLLNTVALLLANAENQTKIDDNWRQLSPSLVGCGALNIKKWLIINYKLCPYEL